MGKNRASRNTVLAASAILAAAASEGEATSPVTLAPESTENTAPESTENTAPESTENTAPESTENTAPESTENTAPESTTDAVFLPSDVVTADSLLANRPKSIRALVMSGLQANVSREAIAAAILAHFPTSQAAAKSSIHISWYAGKMRKAGVDVPKVAGKGSRATTVVSSASTEQEVAAA